LGKKGRGKRIQRFRGPLVWFEEFRQGVGGREGIAIPLKLFKEKREKESLTG